MANSNLFLKAKLTDKTSNAEDTLRVLCEYTEAGDTPTTPVTTNLLSPANNFTYEIGTTNIIRYIPKASIVIEQSVTGLSLDLGSSDTLKIFGITYPEVASVPPILTPSSATLRYEGTVIGSLSYETNVFGGGSSLVFSIELPNGESSEISVSLTTSPLIDIAWGKNGNYII